MGLAGLGATVSPQIVEASIAKIVAWTSDVRSAEVRKASQDALYSLFSLHPGEITRILGTLPKVCQVIKSNCGVNELCTGTLICKFCGD